MPHQKGNLDREGRKLVRALVNNTLQSLPLIDISGIHTADTHVLRAIADDIGYAARKVGFFRITGHGIDQELIERAYGFAEQFFSMPDAFKRQYYIGLSSNHRGYVPFSEKGDYSDEVNRSYEAYDLGLELPEDDPDYLAGNRLLGPNVWPNMPGFKETISAYYDQISSLGHVISSTLELHLGLKPGAMTQHMSKPISQLRLLHYVRKSNTVDSSSVNMGAHTDYECLKLLHTRNAGLQVMTAEDRWIDVPVDHKAYVVNIGDMLEAWTNGQFRSTPHRVLNLSPERFSMPYFVAANHDTLIEPFPEILGDNQSKYTPFRAGAHLERMLVRDFPYLRDPNRNTLAEKQPGISNPFENRMNQRSD